mmetsp:Transcript_6893/g.10888  ORF Transcript_6893/g.10888 Transcript_6893/m.10888 type:complete len:116 (-) Transcript_6893:1147-1494(-)
MASLFKQLSEDMERVAQVVEEGTKFMMGEIPDMGETTASSSDPTTGGGGGGGSYENNDGVQYAGDGEYGDSIFDDIDGMEGDYGSPLMGMADNVMSDIMSTQVCRCAIVLLPAEH